MGKGAEIPGLKPGRWVKITTKNGLKLVGLVLQRYEIFDLGYITLKLTNGYNVGVRIDNIAEVEEAEQPERGPSEEFKPEKTEVAGGKKERIHILATGGTIASKIDYVTGGVTPILKTEELLDAVPELSRIAEFSSEVFSSIFSENMTPKHWEALSRRIYDLFKEDPERGIIVTHGTDTLGYTAAALSFSLGRLLSPVVLIGAQRSSDRPSSDSAFNLISASFYVQKRICEVAVVMHGESGDTYALAHRGTRVRKMHSSRRDAFQSISSAPIAKIDPYSGKVTVLRKDVNICGEERFDRLNEEPKLKFSDKVFLLKFFPGMSPEIIDILVERGIKGIVIEGTGLGHVSEDAIGSIKRAVDSGVLVAITTQCLFGSVNLNVYSTGRMLLKAGALGLGNMLPETAYVKLSWALGNYELEDAKEVLLKNLAGEYELREQLNYYPKWYHGEV